MSAAGARRNADRSVMHSTSTAMIQRHHSPRWVERYMAGMQDAFVPVTGSDDVSSAQAFALWPTQTVAKVPALFA